MSLEQAVDRFIENSDEIKSNEALKVTVEETYREIWSELLPKVNLLGNYTYTDYPDEQSFQVPLPAGGFETFPKSENYGLSLEVIQPLFLGGKISSSVSMASLQKNLSLSETALKKRKLIFDFIQSLIIYEKSKRLKKVYEESKQNQQTYLLAVKKKLNIGSAKDFEFYQAESEVFALETKILEISKVIENLESVLRIQLNLKTKDLIKQEFRFESLPLSSAITVAEAKQKSKSQDLRWVSLENQEKVISEQKQFEQSDIWPQISLFGRYGYQHSNTEALFKEKALSYSYGVQIKWSLFSGFSSFYNRNKWQAQREQLRLQKSNLNKLIDTQLNQTIEKYSRLLSQRKKVEQWLSSAKKSYQSALKSYRLGGMGSIQFIQIQQAFNRSQEQWEQINADLLLSQLELRFVTGEKIY